MLTLLGDDVLYNDPDRSDLESWASAYGLSFPVLSDGGFSVGRRYTSDSSYPNYTLIAPGGEIIIAGASSVSAAQIEAVLP